MLLQTYLSLVPSRARVCMTTSAVFHRLDESPSRTTNCWTLIEALRVIYNAITRTVARQWQCRPIASRENKRKSRKLYRSSMATSPHILLMTLRTVIVVSVVKHTRRESNRNSQITVKLIVVVRIAAATVAAVVNVIMTVIITAFRCRSRYGR